MADWTKNELLAYTLLYAANSDFKESNSERNIILSKIDIYDFQKIKNEFDQDSDYTCIQKIMAGLKAHDFSAENISELLLEIKVLFFSDGAYDIKEQNLLMFLKKLLT
jgi:thiosulfate/3-mercaptopyruvate sulfurtransferase